MSGRFADRVCLITGSTGMAASAARAVVAEEGSVFIVSRNAEHASALADELHAGWHAADLAHEDEVEGAVAACLAAFGRIDALYNVAGISGRRFGDGPLHEATLAGWEAVMAANVTSMFLVMRAVVRQMLAQEPAGGAILNMSSQLARYPSPGHFATHAYAASKGAIEALTRAAAASYAPHGIRVNAIAPALVATPMSARARADPAILRYLAGKQPLAHGPMDPDDVTPTALHLLSDDARMVTGQVIAVDAGWAVSEG